MKRLAAALLVSLLPSIAAADDESYDEPTYDDSVAGTPRVYGDVIVDNAAVTAAEYRADGIEYPVPDVRPLPDGTADCNSYVNDVLNRAGIEMPPTSTRDLENNINYEPVDVDDAQPGDVIWQPGHMGIYTGTDDGDPYGWQMGMHGTNELPWGEDGVFPGGDDTRYYRPMQTADFEDQIGDQIDEIWPTPALGQTSPVYSATSSSGCSSSGPCAGAAR